MTVRPTRVAGSQPRAAIILLAVQTMTPDGLDTLRAASAGWASRESDTPASTPWVPRIFNDIEVSQSAVDAIGLGGRVAIGVADIDLANADGACDDMIALGTADGRPAALRVVSVTDPAASDGGSALDDVPFAFIGIVRAVEDAGGQHARLSAVDVVERMATPLQTNLYAGTGGLEGPTTLAGRPKPVCLGQVFNVAPVALGDINLGHGALPTYQTHWRGITAHDAVRIRGVAQTAVGGTPTIGQYVDVPASGVFQLGASADGVVTADVRGDSVSGYVDSTATVLRRLVQSLAPAYLDAELDLDSFTIADADLPGTIGWFRGADEITASDAAAQILAGCGAVMGGGRTGKLRIFDPLGGDDDQFTLPDAWILDVAPRPLPAGLRPLPATVSVDWQRNWTPLTDLAGSVSDSDRALLAGAQLGPVRLTSPLIAANVAQPRDLRLPGLYVDGVVTLVRCFTWQLFLEAGPRLFDITTDRYLNQIECGDVGRVYYPAYGLDAGVRCVVVGWRERLGARRVTLTVMTVWDP